MERQHRGTWLVCRANEAVHAGCGNEQLTFA
jgi:hypothetical protein